MTEERRIGVQRCELYRRGLLERSAGRYALVIGGARVEFGDDASAATLRRVLEALR